MCHLAHISIIMVADVLAPNRHHSITFLIQVWLHCHMYHTMHYNTYSTQKCSVQHKNATLVPHKNALSDTKIHGSTQKFPGHLNMCITLQTLKELQSERFTGQWSIAFYVIGRLIFGEITHHVWIFCSYRAAIEAVEFDILYMHVAHYNSFYHIFVNSLSLSDCILHSRFISTLVQVMAWCCYTTPSHYLNQHRFIVKKGCISVYYLPRSVW